MREHEAFIAFINQLKIASPTITDEQRKGFLRLGVQQHGLTIDEATYILNAAGLTIGEQINYFEVLGFSIDEIQRLDELAIANRVEVAHKKLYAASLRAGGRPRADGRSEEQWRTLLNQARDVLIDAEKRQEHIALLQNSAIPSIETLSEINNTASEQTQSVSEEQQTPSIPLEKDDMVLIPAGEFQMGSNDAEANDNEQPVHNVFLDAFFIDKYPVTNSKFKEFVEANPRWRNLGWMSSSYIRKYRDNDYLKNWFKGNYPKGTGDRPVNWVSWYAAMAYSQWVGKRLPTEAEWEKAARGGLIGQRYPWGNEIIERNANFGKRVGETTPIGKYPPNGYGICDITGNVSEWCLDEWDREFYISSKSHNPVSGGSIENISKDFTKSKTSRVIRGGSWYSAENEVRVSSRGWLTPWKTNSIVGFRCVKPITT